MTYVTYMKPKYQSINVTNFVLIYFFYETQQSTNPFPIYLP